MSNNKKKLKNQRQTISLFYFKKKKKKNQVRIKTPRTGTHRLRVIRVLIWQVILGYVTPIL